VHALARISIAHTSCRAPDSRAGWVAKALLGCNTGGHWCPMHRLGFGSICVELQLNVQQRIRDAIELIICRFDTASSYGHTALATTPFVLSDGNGLPSLSLLLGSGLEQNHAMRPGDRASECRFHRNVACVAIERITRGGNTRGFILRTIFPVQTLPIRRSERDVAGWRVHLAAAGSMSRVLWSASPSPWDRHPLSTGKSVPVRLHAR
jgi:hypothetical protein